MTQSCNSSAFGNSNACVYCRNNANVKLANSVLINRNGYTGDINVPYDVHFTYCTGFVNNIGLPSGLSLSSYITNSNVTIK